MGLEKEFPLLKYHGNITIKKWISINGHICFEILRDNKVILVLSEEEIKEFIELTSKEIKISV
jgi:hypothetical protein